MIPSDDTAREIPIKTVCSTVFGRYPKISVEEAVNMIQSDGWMVDYCGYENIFAINPASPMPDPISANGVGRGIYRSIKQNVIYVVIYNLVYIINSDQSRTFVGTINTYVGDVFIAEDFQGHIAICDKTTIWIYTVATGSFLQATLNGTAPLDFTPGYVAYHGGRFLAPDLRSQTWRISEPTTGNMQFPNNAQHVGGFQAKADYPVAIVPIPGGGNNIIVMGSSSGQLWQLSSNAALFPYILQSSVNFDYGTINADSLSIETDTIAWVAQNEKSSPFIMYSTGGSPQRISTDGIDFLLARLNYPENCHGFLFRQDGHLIYQFVFPDDNVSYIYDFNTQKFFTTCDENMNYHIAKSAVSFNNDYYMISLNDGNVYRMDTTLTTYNYGYNSNGTLINQEIPRIIVTDTARAKDTFNFIAESLTIPFEMGNQPDPAATPARCDLAVSQNGGEYFSNFVPMVFNQEGQYKNRFVYYGLGMSNELTIQLRLWSYGRFVMGNGILNIRQ